ncbi:MAG: exodeoxyribonuclease VII small subunit [Deltaproteobacteria bacterium]|nr:exodeoxyribonuclease VII small subunit [Deltaproteobacteria bacterium]
MPARRSASNKPEAAPTESFEGALEQLEGLVEQLESGDLPLEDALKAFEQGVALSRRCAGELDAAERRIEVLVEQGAGLVTEPFDEPLETDEDDAS